MTSMSFNLEVEGMHCGGCVRRVQAALEKVPGVSVETVVVGKANGTFDPDETSAVAIADAITRAGYPARLADGSRGGA